MTVSLVQADLLKFDHMGVCLSQAVVVLASGSLTLYRAEVSTGHPVLTYIFNFWHSGTLALSSERQSARMSEIKKCKLDLDGTEHFEMLPSDATAL